MFIACLDLEGVLVPEIWIKVAEHTGIAELRATTRDVPDYDQLMHRRLRILREHGLKLADIQRVIAGMEPLPGAKDFLDWLRSNRQVLILSDTFYQFAAPLMRQLDWPTLFCHHLVIDDEGMIAGYQLRRPDGKKRSVLAMRELNFRTIAVGDSYNDTAMLAAADAGILFRPPQNVIDEFPQFPVVTGYEELKAAMLQISEEWRK